MKRNILLIEPKYKNKYPPIGLMKISTYHKMLGDNVTFFKGDLKDLVIENLTEECTLKLSEQFTSFKKWYLIQFEIKSYIKSRKKNYLDQVLSFCYQYGLESDFTVVENTIKLYSEIYSKKQYKYFPKWDRIYITTLFTFYWNVTVEAIHYAKNLVNDNSKIWVGGVLASLLFDELIVETGIIPHKGLLDKPGILDGDIPQAKNLIIDDLPLDYSILDEIDYVYPTGSAYFTFMTKGCTRKCSFCSVPILEPTYKPKIETLDKFSEIKELFGEQQNLLLMDNNVLASPKFSEIIQEIKDMGFIKGATFVEPNQLEIAIKNLKNGTNEKSNIRKAYNLLVKFLKKLKNQKHDYLLSVLMKHQVFNLNTLSKDGLISTYTEISDFYEKNRSKSRKLRYVDFNQGTDARYVTDDLMRLMSEIPIRPLRIAFDYWGMKKQYENAVRLAAKYGIRDLSNYILYNFKDTPEELYNRLYLNVKLGEELQINIFSFPMKYIPLFGEEAKSRLYIGEKWNRKYIRAIQSILNVTKGIVAPGRKFFELAFGDNIEKFKEIIFMPETYIIYRSHYENNGVTNSWREDYSALSVSDLDFVSEIVLNNKFGEFPEFIPNSRVEKFLKHYFVKKEDLKLSNNLDSELHKNRLYINKLIKEDNFKKLTITYDFESETIKKKTIMNIF
jgi:hypothetical protein